MIFKILILSGLTMAYCLNIVNTPVSRLIGAALISSSLNTNIVDVDNYKTPPSHKHNSNYVNSDSFDSTSIVVERNNIYIYGEITPESCEALKNKLIDLDFNGKLFKLSYNSDPPPINIHVQSGGGSLMNAFYIVDLIGSISSEVNTYVDGYSASAASLINLSLIHI